MGRPCLKNKQKSLDVAQWLSVSPAPGEGLDSSPSRFQAGWEEDQIQQYTQLIKPRACCFPEVEKALGPDLGVSRALLSWWSIHFPARFCNFRALECTIGAKDFV